MAHSQQLGVDVDLGEKLAVLVGKRGVRVLGLGDFGDVEGNRPLDVKYLYVKILHQGQYLFFGFYLAALLDQIEYLLVELELVSQLERLILYKSVNDGFFLLRVFKKVVIPVLHDLAHIDARPFEPLLLGGITHLEAVLPHGLGSTDHLYLDPLIQIFALLYEFDHEVESLVVVVALLPLWNLLQLWHEQIFHHGFDCIFDINIKSVQDTNFPNLSKLPAPLPTFVCPQ